MTTDEKLDSLTGKVDHLIGLHEGREVRCVDHSRRIDRIERALVGMLLGLIGLIARAFIGKG